MDNKKNITDEEFNKNISKILTYLVLIIIVIIFGNILLDSSKQKKIEKENLINVTENNDVLLNPGDEKYINEDTIANNTNSSISYSSSDPSIVKVDKNGKIKAVSSGEAQVYIKSDDGEYNVKINVIVKVLPEKITLNKQNIEMDKNTTTKLTYLIEPQDVEDKTVIWESENSDIASVDQNGLVTALKGGKTKIKIKTKNNIVDSCDIVVKSKVEKINIEEENIVVAKDMSKVIKINVYPEDANDKELVWYSENNNIIKVDNNGKITGVGYGKTTIIVKSKDGKYTDTVNVEVKKDLVKKISVNETDLSLNKGEYYIINYKVSPTTAYDKTVSFKSSNTDVATVESDGKIIAKNGGKAIITIQSNDGSASKKINLTVKVPLKSISFDKESITLTKGAKQILNVIFSPIDATNKDLKYITSNKKIVTVSSAGVISAIGVGNATITVISSEGNFKDNIKVTVNNLINNISINKTILQLTKNSKYKLNVTISPTDASNKTLTWKSSNNNVVSVDQSGNLQAKELGTSTITVTSSNGKKASCTVYVTSLSITSGSKTIMDEEFLQLTSKISGGIGKEKITWNSSDSSIATVSSTGKVIGKKVGSAVITATIKTTENKIITSNSFKVNVRARKILMVGNSKTAHSFLSIYVARIAKKQGYSLEGTIYPANDSSQGITYFKDTGGKTLNKILEMHREELSQSYDYVVLQEQADTYSDSNYANYYNGVKNILDIVYSKNKNVKMFIRKTWILSDSSDKLINQAYVNTNNIISKIKKEKGYNLALINDGPSMYYALDKGYPVMKDDKRHQTYYGAYLAASCIYSNLFNQDPILIKYVPTSLDQEILKDMKSIAKKYCY